VESFEFVLVANGPGELSSLVKPIVEQIKKYSTKANPIKTTLVQPPCQFSSGNEMQYIKTLKVNQIIPAEEYRKWILSIPTKRELKFKYRGVVLYLGGDLMHAVLISKKLGYKVYAYLHGQKASWKNIFAKFFVQDEKTKHKLLKNRFQKDRIKVVGDLMLNSIESKPKAEVIHKWQLSENKPIVAMLPGSRDWEIDYMLPFYEDIGRELKSIIPGVQLMLIISPFTTLSKIEKMVDEDIFDVMTSIDSITAADLVLTIPGTNTAQIAAIGAPALMLFPLNKLDNVPLEGLLYYITKIPFLGKMIKRFAADIINRKTKFFALPNIKAGRMVMPEIRGNISIEEVVEEVLKLLNNAQKTKQIGHNLKKAMGESDAAEKIVGGILNENSF